MMLYGRRHGTTPLLDHDEVVRSLFSSRVLSDDFDDVRRYLRGESVRVSVNIHSASWASVVQIFCPVMCQPPLR